jgi:hypothetical protein
MSTITVSVPDALDAALAKRIKDVGAHTKEEYLHGLVEADCVAGDLERTLVERSAGPFQPLPEDWMEQVRKTRTSLRDFRDQRRRIDV